MHLMNRCVEKKFRNIIDTAGYDISPSSFTSLYSKQIISALKTNFHLVSSIYRAINTYLEIGYFPSFMKTVISVSSIGLWEP